MDLKELRNEIDRIDDQLVQLFAQRMEVSARIADYKKENGLPIFVPTREQEKLQDVAQKAGPEMEIYTKALYAMLFELSRGYQSQRNATRTALYHQISEAIRSTEKRLPRQEAVGCFTTGNEEPHLVCQKLFATNPVLDFKHIQGLLNALSQGLCRYGILPLDHNTHQIYDLLAQQQLYIVRTIRLADHRQYLCISRQMEIYPGADRCSIRAALADHPGALYKVLARLYTLGINVNHLESRPVTDKNFRAMFYFDLEISVYSEEFILLICELGDLCEEFAYLGSYTEVF